MFDSNFCCCAIPLINVGIYTAITEFAFLSLAVGVVAIAAPSIVAAAVPSFCKWILAVICFVMVFLQVLGYMGVKKESPNLFARYVTLNALLLFAALGVSLAFLIISAIRHSTAVNTCVANFGVHAGSPSTSSLLGGAGNTDDVTSKAICNILLWVQIGVMGGLWALFAIVQGYLLFIQRVYTSEQRAVRKKYNSVYSNEDIPLASRASLHDGRSDGRPGAGRRDSEVWEDDADPFGTGVAGAGYTKARQGSVDSYTAGGGEPYEHRNLERGQSSRTAASGHSLGAVGRSGSASGNFYRDERMQGLAVNPSVQPWTPTTPGMAGHGANGGVFQERGYGVGY